MADPRFFIRASAKSVGELAEIAGATIGSGSDSGRMIEDVAPLDAAGPKQVSFLDNIKYKDSFKVTKAGACIVSPDAVAFAPEGVALIVSKQPYKAYALIAQAFYPVPLPEAQISPAAHIGQNVTLGKGCVIEAGVVIGDGAEIGESVWIEPNAVIGRNVKIGAYSRIGANANVSYAEIGHHVHIYCGCCIGQDGFGFAIDPAGYVKVPQLGRVIIGDGVEIGANTTIDRGSGPDTVIGSGTWIDNLVQIAHNVRMGRGCVIAGQCGISGSTVLGDYVVLAGQVGVAGHLKIGTGARVAAKTGILRNIEAGQEVMGYPAVPVRQFFKQTAYLNRLVENKSK
ncbi:MAG: UDP-3-O-(3-hydroxymyristoyl)glucosamine N-acyltransferase [Micavibrio sp.]